MKLISLTFILTALFVTSCNSQSESQKSVKEKNNTLTTTSNQFTASFIVSHPLPHGWGYAYGLEFHELFEGEKPPIGNIVNVNVGIGKDSIVPLKANFTTIDTTIFTFQKAAPEDTAGFPYEIVGFKDLDGIIWEMVLTQ